METPKEIIERLIPDGIVSLRVFERECHYVVSLLYMNGMPVTDVMHAVISVYPDVVFEDISRIYSKQVIHRLSRMIGLENEDAYWEDTDTGCIMDEWLADKRIISSSCH